MRLLRILLPLLLVCGALLVVGSPAHAAASTTTVRHLRVKWTGTKAHRTMTKSATVPGIGQLKLVCRPNDTVVQLRADDRSRETQMWMAKYETKKGHAVVSVKTARIYRYATANDDGRGGTGAVAHEGLNQQAHIENYESGYMDGIISQRPGRNQPAAAAALAPATSFTLTWWWTGFRHPRSWQLCDLDLTMRTLRPAAYGVDWHGDADAAVADSQEAVLPRLGTLTTTCEPGHQGEQDMVLLPQAGVSGYTGAFVETISGEGAVEDHVDTDEYEADPETGLVGPIPLPTNGMLRIFLTVGKATEDLIVSSYVVDNDTQDPGLDLCEVAAAPF